MSLEILVAGSAGWQTLPDDSAPAAQVLLTEERHLQLHSHIHRLLVGDHQIPQSNHHQSLPTERIRPIV